MGVGWSVDDRITYLDHSRAYKRLYRLFSAWGMKHAHCALLTLCMPDSPNIPSYSSSGWFRRSLPRCQPAINLNIVTTNSAGQESASQTNNVTAAPRHPCWVTLLHVLEIFASWETVRDRHLIPCEYRECLGGDDVSTCVMWWMCECIQAFVENIDKELLHWIGQTLTSFLPHAKYCGVLLSAPPCWCKHQHFNSCVAGIRAGELGAEVSRSLINAGNYGPVEKYGL